MKKLKFLLCMFLLSMVSTSIYAIGEALPKGTLPEAGKKYYIYADTYHGGKYVNRFLYNNNGTLALNTVVDEESDHYIWICSEANGEYTFQNAGDNSKYLGHKALTTSAYNFTLGKAESTHAGITIWSDDAKRYFVTKNDGKTFDQSTGTYNQANSDWCTDYVFIEYVKPTGNTLSITTNFTHAGEIIVNGTAAELPYKKWENTITLPVTITATANNPYKFLGFYVGEENKGTEITIKSLETSVEYEARYKIDIFSSSTDNENLIPVRIYNNRDNNYVVKMNVATDYTGKAVNSGVGTYEESEIWYLVGDESSFKLYNKVAGTTLPLKLTGTSRSSAATLATDGTELCLVTNNNGSFGICPKNATEQSFNMHGGKGNDIKLYDTSDDGSKWLFKRIAADKVLQLNYNTQLEGGYKENYKIGELLISMDGVNNNSMLEKTTVPTSRTCYLPENAKFSISTGFICHGWKMDINGNTSIEYKEIPEGGLEVNVNIAVDTENKYQYLYYSPKNGHPYRIPAITTTANGYVFAINDYRPCNMDIGYGEVDLVMRHSTAAGNEWDGYSWTDEIMIADGLGNTSEGIWKVGFGDPAIVADREKNEILVMSVCGNRTCYDGNYGEGGENENPNRISRIRIKFNETEKKWEVGQPEEVTYDIYPLFKDENGNVHAASMFIGAGRIAQSSKIKVGDYYRIYCSVWTVTKTIRQHHNYVLYSDDFGETWHLLGELGYENSPAPYGNEPKCEELPDGSVLLSSRKGYGRYFNVFRYTDIEKGEGSWLGAVSTDAVGDLKWGNNDTNGEPLRVGNVLFQSAPTGSLNDGKDTRSHVAVFYKILSNNPADYTPTALSNGWTKVPISKENSAYSSMCILPGGEKIGFFYEEAPGAYSMVYVPLTLKEILTEEAYEATKQQEAPYTKGLIYTYANMLEKAVKESKTEHFKALELQTSKNNEDYYLWTNAQEGSEGPIANIIDGDNTTHFHSAYKTKAEENHFLQINLGKGNELPSFAFRYATRKADNNFPKTIEVYGSTDGNDFTYITTVSNLPTGNINTNVTYTSEEIVCDKEYSYLRFTVTANNSGNKEAGGHPYFHMAEFSLLAATGLPEELVVAIETANTAIAVAREVLTTAETAEEYNAAAEAIKKAYDDFLAAIKGDNDDTTCIKNVETTMENSVIFDLAGRKVKNISAPGMYIVNGKKVLVK